MCVTFFTICQFIILKHSLFDIVGKVFKLFVIVEFFLLFWIYYSKRVKFILPIAILGLPLSLLFFFFFLGWCWHDIGLTILVCDTSIYYILVNLVMPLHRLIILNSITNFIISP